MKPSAAPSGVTGSNMPTAATASDVAVRARLARLDERDTRSTNHVDDQRLGEQGSDEPAGLEQRRIGP